MKAISYSQNVQVSSTLKDDLKKLGHQSDQSNYLSIPKPVLCCIGGTLPMVMLLSVPVYAEKRPLPRAANIPLELNTPPDPEPSSLGKNGTAVNSNTDSDGNAGLDGAALSEESDHAPAQSLLPLSMEAGQVNPPTLKQAIFSLAASSEISESTVEPTDEPTEPVPLSDPNLYQSAQADPDPNPSQFSEPSAESSPEPTLEPSSDSSPETSSDFPSNNRWQFSIEPYFFAPLSVQADVTAAGRSASIDLGLDDVLSLDRAFDAGLRLEARYNRLGFILDGYYISAGQSGTLGVTFPEESLQRFGINTAARVDADASISIDEVTVDAAVSYRVVDTVLGNSAESPDPYPRLVVAPILGLRTRFSWQELEVDSVRLGDISLPVDREFDFSRTTIEPLIGAQLGLDLSQRWTFNVRGDVSGFNINAEEDFTWNLLVGTQYHISPSVSLQLAYRFNGFDFEDGEGLRRARLNLYQNGLWLSGIFRF